MGVLIFSIIWAISGGEFATYTSQAQMIQFLSDWCIEAGLLGEIFRSVRLTYLKHAREIVGIYESLAEMHDLRISFDFHEELKTVEVFAKAIDSGVVDFCDQHFG